MITQWIQFTVKPGEIAAFQAALATLERESRAETGCALYAAFQTADHPEVFTVLESWETSAAFEAHRQTPHIAAFKDTCARMIAEKSALSLNPVGAISP
jgi:quinol monooxygenase YgiN